MLDQINPDGWVVVAELTGSSSAIYEGTLAMIHLKMKRMTMALDSVRLIFHLHLMQLTSEFLYAV